MWTSSPEVRLLKWREFREQINTLSKEEAIQKTAALWATAPLINQYLAPDLIKEWPDPWVLLHDNCYDDISITLGIVYTLALSSDRFDDVFITVLTDINTSVMYNTAWFENGKYIVNYEYGKVLSSADLSSDLNVKYKYSYEDLLIGNYK